jgi:hypothetical protein
LRTDDQGRQSLAAACPSRTLSLKLSALLGLEGCRKQKARLVIAKLDRLSRNLAFIATLMESGVEFVAADMPFANKLTIHILAAVAEHEREAISERTKNSVGGC